ncbi:Crp/Fnr family transcriptional regulator [Sphingobium sp. RSMS]|uniref:Crp/Fnr family transcriptional regulator n=1 Tax=Sphingobium sp. RSMS TaxID=520734 RepID=UPI0010FA0632|nr:Crp/Fnr family transcriptional regulator [Sphingobium sp. RSMS]UXC90124.1 Crp/Fnr family transcriptional regulator [Sphingobium sp. RSMS]
MTSTDSPVTSLVGKLRRLAPLDMEDEQALSSLSFRIGHVRARTCLVREGTMPYDCCLLVEGFASRSKVASDGGRQIVSFHVPGDVLDIQHLFLERADHDVHAISDATIAWTPMSQLRALIMERPAIGMAFWRDALIDASISREWVLNVGRRNAKSRVAHMLCEFVARCNAAGVGTPERMKLPFTQEEIGDATGITTVHVNRMLRALTEDGLIRRDGRFLEIEDWDGFQKLAGFDKGYLHAAA